MEFFKNKNIISVYSGFTHFFAVELDILESLEKWNNK
jgi:hypothetical protein